MIAQKKPKKPKKTGYDNTGNSADMQPRKQRTENYTPEKSK